MPIGEFCQNSYVPLHALFFLQHLCESFKKGHYPFTVPQRLQVISVESFKRPLSRYLMSDRGLEC
jgi:hypothetical protein